uniref:Uncharacterized protein n=1 Tax=Ditylenchus dipsaci TaxID=166011 RepID=A0A915DM38_9BILA
MVVRPYSGNPKYLIYSSHEGIMAHQSSDGIVWQRNSAAFPNGISWVTDYTQNDSKVRFGVQDLAQLK